MNNLITAICIFVLASCSNKMHELDNMDDLKITVLPFDCIDGKTFIAKIRISNRSKNTVHFDGDGFIFKGLYDKNGISVDPNVRYDPIKEMKGKTYSIEPGEEKSINISFNNLQYFELSDEEYIIEFEYSNLIKKSDGIIRGIIPIDRIAVRVCES